MGKRVADNQITKEKYDPSAGGNEGIAGSPFNKASSETLAKRKIIKTSSKWKQARSGGGGGNAGSGGAFANFNFGSAYSTSSTPAPKPTGKPLFAMPTLPETSILVPTGNATNTSTIFLSTAVNDSTGNDGTVTELVEGFKSYMNKRGNERVSLEMPVAKFMSTYLKLKKKPKPAGTEKKEAPKSSSSSSPSDADKASKPLFPPVSSSNPPPAFSFPASSSAPSFSFGTTKTNTTTAATTTTTTAVSSPVPAPFSFAMKSTPAVAPSSAPTAAAASSEDSEKKKESEEESKALEGDADKEWNTVHQANVKVYHFREKNDKGGGIAKQFASGYIKLQKHKENGNNRRMVMRNNTGKVTLNLAISSDMEFKKVQGKQARITFFGLRDADYGDEMHAIRCRADDVDVLHAKLLELKS